MAEKVPGQSVYAWFFQRISGLFLAFFLVTHLNVHHLFHDITKHGIINFNSVSENLASNSIFWKVFYFLFIPFVVFHAMNGLWQIVADFRPSGGTSPPIKILLWLLGIALVVIGAMTLNNFF